MTSRVALGKPPFERRAVVTVKRSAVAVVS